MKLVTTVATLAIGLSGCNSLAGFNNALLPQLKPIDARIHTDITCGDLANQAIGLSSGSNNISAAAAIAIVQACERRDATQTLTLDPQGARKALDATLAKPLPGTP